MITIPPAIEVVERNGPGHPDTLAGKNPVSHVGKIYNVIAALVDRGDRGGQGGGGDAGLHDRLACEPPNHPQRQALGEDGGLNAGPALESKIEGILDFWLESTDDLVE